MEVSWQVTGIRQDAFANANRTPIEEDKPKEQCGTYLHPNEHAKPETAGVDAEQRAKMNGKNPEGERSEAPQPSAPPSD